MKILKAFFILMLLTAVGGFVFFAMNDVPLKQTTVSKKIPPERLLP